MDSFTEKILERARERQKIIGDKPLENNQEESDQKKTTQSTPNKEPKVVEETLKSANNAEATNKDESGTGNVKRMHKRQNSKVQISSYVVNDDDMSNNIDVEISVRSSDNIRIEVEVQDEPEVVKVDSAPSISESGKRKLHKLAKLYTDGDISSPIHKTEEKFATEMTNVVDNANKPLRCINKLAQLAQNISNWEDDVKPRQEEIKEKSQTKRPWKKPAPQPPVAPPSPSPSKDKINEVADKREVGEKWDKNILDKLESQGFTRTESNSKLIYKFYDRKQDNENVPEKSKPDTKLQKEQENKLIKPSNVANKVNMFQNSPTKTIKDPALLSVGERKALFERNQGVALLPKAPFAMPIPSPSSKPAKPQHQPVVKTVIATIEPPPKPGKLQNNGIASKMAALLENKNKNTISQEQIASNTKRELQKDMDLLLNRHNRNKVLNEEIPEETNENTPMIEKDQVEIVCNNTSPTGRKEKRKSTENKPRISDSPRVTAVLDEVKRIKVAQPKDGRLYPCLSDIETATETETDAEQEVNTSSENSYEDDSYEDNSYIQQDKTRESSKRTSTDNSEDSLRLSDMEEYMDVPLPNVEAMTGPTPPKQGRISNKCKSTEASNSFNYKNYGNNSQEFKSPMKKRSPRKSEAQILVEDGDDVLPLTHTVSFYRRQQNQVKTPVRQIIRQPVIEEIKEIVRENDGVQEKIDRLTAEVHKQQLIIAQTSQALNLCTSTIEFAGSTEQVEAERVLLLASHRRQAALNEIQRLRVEETLRSSGDAHPDKGTLTISNISLPLKREYVRALAAAGGKGHHVVCLVKCDEHVFATQVVSTVANSKDPDMKIQVPGVIVLNDIYSDFTVTFEVHCLQAQEERLPHHVKYHINKKGTNKLTPKKNKQECRLVVPPKESPGGPNIVKTTTFALMGYVVFSMQGINRNQWTLNRVPPMSPLEGTVEMKVNCEIHVQHRGFLTMFEDISGFGAWHRRWCLLKGSTLSYWKYPDDEQKRPPIDSIDLKSCITKQVAPVSRDLCARLHTILLEREREAQSEDKNSLTTICKGPKTIIRHLLSADTKEERIEWSIVLNKTLSIYGSTNNE